MSRRGFTLIEILIALGMLGVVLAAAMAMLVGTNGASERVRRIGDVQEGARLGIEELASELRTAGLGAMNGQIGVCPGSGTRTPRRMPVIYSGPNVTVTEPGGQTIVTNSIYIVSADPTSMGIGSDSTGTQGVVVRASSGTALSLMCSNASGATVDCSAGANPVLQSSNPPLLVGDFRNAAFLSPTILGSPVGIPPIQSLDYAEEAGCSISPDPKAPFGFAPGANVSRARVSHWYMRQTSPGAIPQLVRSHPTLTGATLSANCAATDLPFLDETNSSGGVVGTVMTLGAIESLQFRYVVDPAGTDDPTQFTVLNSISVCDTASAGSLREVRLQIVSRATSPDRDTNGAALNNYATPGFEGVSPSSAVQDAYPRRAFVMSVVPRTLQRERL